MNTHPGSFSHYDVTMVCGDERYKAHLYVINLNLVDSLALGHKTLFYLDAGNNLDHFTLCLDEGWVKSFRETVFKNKAREAVSNMSRLVFESGVSHPSLDRDSLDLPFNPVPTDPFFGSDRYVRTAYMNNKRLVNICKKVKRGKYE